MNKEIFKNNKELIENIIEVDDNDNLGYKIITNKQEITIYISNSADCCESWGALNTEDNLNDYIGAELLSIETVDYEYNKHPLTKDEAYFHSEECSCCFIDINTDNGLLQFVLYNIHNGYYGHGVSIKSNQLNYEAIV